jgi:hypothetical protein
MVQELDNKYKIMKTNEINKKNKHDSREDDPFRHELPHVLDERCKEWYDRVYLCSQNVTTFKCKKYESFEAADQSVTKADFSTMIPMCRYTPEFMDRFFLKRKLFGMFQCKLK